MILPITGAGSLWAFSCTSNSMIGEAGGGTAGGGTQTSSRTSNSTIGEAGGSTRISSRTVDPIIRGTGDGTYAIDSPSSSSICNAPCAHLPGYSLPFSFWEGLSFDVSIRVFFFIFFLLDSNSLNGSLPTCGLATMEASLPVLVRNSSIPGTQTRFPYFWSSTFPFKWAGIHLILVELTLYEDGGAFDTLYH